jgi:hypothetical protein
MNHFVSSQHQILKVQHTGGSPCPNVRFWQTGLTRSLATARIRVPWSHNKLSDGQGEALSNEPSMSSTFFVEHRDSNHVAILSAEAFKIVNR